MADSKSIFLSLYSDEELTEEQYQQELIEELGGRVDGFDPKKPLGGRDLKKRIGYVFVESKLGASSNKAKKEFVERVLESSTIENSTLSLIKSAPDAARHREANTRQFALIVNACVDAINSLYESVKATVLQDWLLASQYAAAPLSSKNDCQKRCWVVCTLLNVDTREELDRCKAAELSEQSKRERTATIALIAIYASMLSNNDLEHLLGDAIRAGQLHYSSRALDEDGARELREYAEDQEFIEEDLDVAEDYVSEEDFLKLLNLATKKRDLTLTQYLYAAITSYLDFVPGYTTS